MKKIFMLCAAFFLSAASGIAANELTIKAVMGGEFSARRIYGINPLAGTDQYATISPDGKRIVQYSFKTGQETAVLFDADQTQGEKVEQIDGYIPSPDGKRLLIQTATEAIYRRSSKSEYYIYNIHSRHLARLSDNGKQQAPLWSPDGTQVAFVRESNIFLVKLLYDNAETQVTKDGKFNEIINGG